MEIRTAIKLHDEDINTTQKSVSSHGGHTEANKMAISKCRPGRGSDAGRVNGQRHGLSHRACVIRLWAAGTLRLRAHRLLLLPRVHPPGAPQNPAYLGDVGFLEYCAHPCSTSTA